MTTKTSLQGLLPGLVGILVLVVWAAVSWPGLHSLHQRWIRFDEAYALGYPAIILAVYWLFRHRTVFLHRSLAPAWSALPVFLGALLGHTMGQLVQLQLLQQLGALGMLWGGATLILGWSAGRLLLFPLLLVLLAVPLWDFLIDPLRMMAVWFTQHMLDWWGVPAHIDGYFITLRAGRVEVAGGCSGLNLLLAMTLVGLMFAESHWLPRARRVAIVLLAIAIGILDNWIRVFTLVMIGHYSDMQSELMHHHGNFGWWIFAASLPPFFWLAARIENAGHIFSEPRSVPTPLAPHWRLVTVAAVVTLVTMVVTSALVSQVQQRRGKAVNGFTGPSGGAMVDPAWLPLYLGQDKTQGWRVLSGDRELELIALTYVEQRADKKLIYYGNRIAEASHLQSLGDKMIAPGFNVNLAIVHGANPRVIWWYWWVDGKSSTSAFKTKLLQLQAMLTGDPSAALIALSVPCRPSNCQKTAEDLEPLVAPRLIESRQMARK